MPRFYVTTPIYYVNDVPHIGHAYTTVTADALARWHRLSGDETFFLTGTDEHGLKVARAAADNGITPAEQADRTSVRFRETWELLDISADDFIRTTEPRHHLAVQRLLEKARANGWIEKDTYSGLYCVACEGYYNESDLVEGNCPIHDRPVEHLEEENYFFKLSAFEQPLIEWYESNPEAVQPEGKRNEALGIIRGGLEDISISRTSIDWGVPVPWDTDHVFYVWYDALINYATGIGYGSDDERFQTWWPAVHHLLGKDILRFHCVYWPAMLLAAGEAPPHRLYVHGYLLVGGEKMSKTKLNQIFPSDLVEGSAEHGFAAFGVDGFRYHFLRDTPFGPDGDFSYEGMVARYNADLANNLGNLLARVATVVGTKCGGTGPAPRPDSPLAEVAATAHAEAARRWAEVAPSPRSRGDLEAHPRGERAPRVARALEARPGPGGRRRARRRAGGAPHRGGAGRPGRARHLRRDLASHRPGGLAPRPAPPRGRGVGWLPGRAPGREGGPSLPADPALSSAWFDHHCHLDPATADETVAEAAAAGVERLVTVGTDLPGSRDAVAVAARHPGVWATAGVHPHEARFGLDGLVELLAEPKVVAVGECGLDYHYDHSPREVQRRVFADQIALAHEHDLPLVVHSREAWEDTFVILDAEGVPRRTVFHCFTGGPPEAEAVLERGGWLSFSGIVGFPTAEGLREAARLCPLDRVLVETDSPYLAPVPHRGRRNRPAWVVHVGAALAEVLGIEPGEVAGLTWRNASDLYGL